jgi:hypothetical protein
MRRERELQVASRVKVRGDYPDKDHTGEHDGRAHASGKPKHGAARQSEWYCTWRWRKLADVSGQHIDLLSCVLYRRCAT